MKQMVNKIFPLFLTRVITLIFGSVGSHLVSISAIPLLTRLYTPDDFGRFAFILSIVFVLGPIISLRYHLAIPKSESKSESMDIAAIGFFLCFMFTLLTFVSTLFLSNFIEISEIENESLFAAIIGVLGFGSFQIANNLALRELQFKKIALVKTVQGILIVTVQVAFTGFGGIGLFAGHVSGLFSSVFLLLRRETIFSIYKAMCSLDWNSCKSILLKYINFPRFSVPATFFGALAKQSPVFVIGFLDSWDTAGIFMLVSRTFAGVVQLIGQAANKVFYSTTARGLTDNAIQEKAAKVIGVMSVLGCTGVIFIGLAEREYIVFLLGSEWEVAYDYLLPLSLISGVQLVATSITSIYITSNKQHVELVFQLTLLVFAVTVLWYTISFHNAIVAITLYSILVAFMYIAQIIYLIDLRNKIIIRYVSFSLICIVLTGFCVF